MPRVLCAVITIGLLFGCGQTNWVRLSPQMDSAPLRQLNRDIRNRTVELVLRDGRSVVARDTRVSPDLTYWDAGGSTGTVRTAEISGISYKNRKKGAVKGLTIGGLILLPMTLLVTYVDPPDDSEGAAGVFKGTASGALWGAGIGALVGSRITYVFIAPRAVRNIQAPETESEMDIVE
jgi:hypothetical protein